MPDFKQEIRAHLAALKLAPLREAEIVEEVSQHLMDRFQELVTGGMSEMEAARVTVSELSTNEVLARELRGFERPYEPASVLGAEDEAGFFSQVWHDVKYGARLLRLSPMFTAVAVLSLALGIGANTAIFQLIDAIRLQTLPIPRPDELAEVKIQNMTWMRGNVSRNHRPLTNPMWELIREQQQAFSGVLAWSDDPRFNLATGGRARYAQGLWVSGDFFNVLGVPPALGRMFTAEDDRRGCGAPGAVLSHSFWQSEYGGDPGVIGRHINLDYKQVQVIGVAAKGFNGLEVGQSFDVAVPICSEAFFAGKDSRLDLRHAWWLTVMGRLKPDWTMERARAHLDTISAGIMEATVPPRFQGEDAKRYKEYRYGAVPASTGLSALRNEYETPLWLLLGLAGLVLLIACANLANLMLARASVREREIAVRVALGASPARLFRQLFTESLLLALIGAAAGLALAQVLSRTLVSYLSGEGTPLFVDLSPDWQMLGFTIAIALLTCLIFGTAPAYRALRTPPSAVIKAAGRGMTASRERFGLRKALVVSQVALSTVLLVGALLFARSLNNINSIDAGFRQDGVVLVDVDGAALDMPQEQWSDFRREALERVRQTPGIDAAGTVLFMPLSGSVWGNDVWLDGADSSKGLGCYFNSVGPGYFSAMQINVLAGREFLDTDDKSAPRVAIVNQAFADQLNGGKNPVGLRIWREETSTVDAQKFEIVGMVANTKYADIREPAEPIVYVPFNQYDRDPGPATRIAVHSNLPPNTLMASIERSVQQVNPQISVDFGIFKTRVEQGLLRDRLMATLSGFFGILAAVLAMVGIYGVISYMVVQRTNEIGIRMALGADRRKVLTMILGQAGVLLLIGLAIGIGMAVAGGRTASALLYGLTATDPLTLTAAGLALAAIALAASYLPARRAAALDPMVALRDE